MLVLISLSFLTISTSQCIVCSGPIIVNNLVATQYTYDRANSDSIDYRQKLVTIFQNNDDVINNVLQLLNTDNTLIHDQRWQYTINTQVGTLNLFDALVHVNTMNITVVLRSSVISQQIHPQYDLVKQCAKTGRRKWKYVGPRKMICESHQVQRGLTPNEISMIHDVLNVKALEIFNNLKHVP